MIHVATNSHQSAWRSPWVYGWFAILVSVVTANFVMIYFALDGSPGLVVDDYYDRGQHYEKNMVARMAANPGWQMQISAPEELPLNEATTFEFNLSTKEGGAVQPDRVIFYAYRPSDAKADFFLSMQERGNGLYQADVTFPLKGVWDVLVSVQKDGEEHNEALRVVVAAGE